MTDNCSTDGDCTNVPGSFTCACKTGYSGDGISCTDIDECTANTDDCHVLATCTNTIGSFTCACNAGYAGDGVTCTNIDECSEHIDNCSPSATCTDYRRVASPARATRVTRVRAPSASTSTTAPATAAALVNEMCVNQIGLPHTCDCVPGFSRPASDPIGACVSSCGNGSRATTEQCDDSNLTDGDGCSASCRIEAGWACHEATRGGTSTCVKTCGDGLIDPPGEECDDAATNSDTAPNACRLSCKRASCGDNVVDNGEACDLGSMNSDTRPDGCRTKCVAAFCGDGIVDPARGEQCDHGFGDPLTDDYCATAAGCRKAVPSGDGGVDAGTTTTHSKGCGCRVAGTSDAGMPTFAGLVLLALACVTRARRRAARKR